MVDAVYFISNKAEEIEKIILQKKKNIKIPWVPQRPNGHNMWVLKLEKFCERVTHKMGYGNK